MLTTKTEKNDDVKVVEINKQRVLQSPVQRLTIFKNGLNLPEKVSYKDKSLLTVSSVKYNINDLDNNEKPIYKCKSKTVTESFEISNLSGTLLFKFNLKKIKLGEFEFSFTDCKTNKTKLASVKNMPAATRNIFQFQFTNEETGRQEVLYYYAEDKGKRYIFYGGLESEGGILICKAVQSFGMHNNKRCLMQFASNIDRTFVYMIVFCMNRYLKTHPKEIPGNFVFMGQNYAF